MSGFVLTTAAADDLDAIWSYVAEDNPTAASRLVRDLYAAINKLVAMPTLGHVRQDVTAPGLRFHTVYSYQIVYREGTDPLEIVRVLSGYRDIPGLLN